MLQILLIRFAKTHKILVKIVNNIHNIINEKVDNTLKSERDAIKSSNSFVAEDAAGVLVT